MNFILQSDSVDNNCSFENIKLGEFSGYEYLQLVDYSFSFLLSTLYDKFFCERFFFMKIFITLQYEERYF